VGGEKMSKQGRVIKDIETLDQAIKAEQDVESGFHSVIDENIAYWKAVEEDVVESYTKLAARIQNENVKRILEGIIEDSRKHRKALEGVTTTLDAIIRDEERHAKLLMDAKSILERTQSHS
jgi:rubrerythrin